MEKQHKWMLNIDAVVNLVLGTLILLLPVGLDKILGMPVSENSFYTTILGGVIFGIGLALLIERFAYRQKLRGLGLEGAIAINFCGAGVLLFWLVFMPPDIPLHGIILLWGIAIIVFAIGFIELFLNVFSDK